MGAGQALKHPRVVLDTNTVVSALLFSCGRLAWLRDAWQSSAFVPVVGHDTASELIRALKYSKLKLGREEQETLLADYLPYAETVPAFVQPSGLPEISDPRDVRFLALAQYAQADALVSRDGDILSVRAKLGTIAVLSAAEFRDWLFS